MSHLKIKRLFIFCVAVAAAFMAQACLIGGDDSSSGGSINGRWQLERIIAVYNLGEGVSLRDTSMASTDTLGRAYMVINGTNFGFVTYDFFTEKPDTLDLPATLVKGQKWVLDGDTATIVRSGNVLRITVPWDGGEEDPDSIVREFSLFTAAFPPAAWVGIDTGTDTTSTGATHEGVWVALSEVLNGESVTYDTTDAYDRFFLRFSGDDLYYIDYDGEFLMSDDRTSATTWRFGTSTLTITSVTSTRLNVRVVGQGFTSNAIFARYNGNPLAGGGGGGAIEAPVDANEPNNSVGQTTSLVVGASKSAALDVGDEDWYSFQAQSGTTYTIQTTGIEVDPYMELFSPSGSLLAEDDDSGESLNPLIVWEATTTGMYSVRLTGYNDAQVGNYSISVNMGGLAKQSVEVVSEKKRRKGNPWRR